MPRDYIEVPDHGGDIFSHDRPLLDFSANVNALGLPDGVKRALMSNLALYERYPDPHCRELSEALARHHGLSASCIACGNGAADVLYRLVWALRPRVGLVIAPTFSEYALALQSANASVRYAMLDAARGFQPDDALLQGVDDVDICFVCNPNNPTGCAAPREWLLRLAARCKDKNALLVVDECFMDFVENAPAYSLLGDLEQLPHVVVLKAFTKIYAMAGIRLGYALCAPPIAQVLAKAGQPWSVSAVAAVCGVAALQEAEYVRASRRLARQGREQLTLGLQKLGIAPFASSANFLLFSHQGCDLYSRLLEKDILIRPCGNFAGLDDTFYRVAVRGESDNDALLRAIGAVLEEAHGRHTHPA